MTFHEGTEGGVALNIYSFFISALKGEDGQPHAPVALPLGVTEGLYSTFNGTNESTMIICNWKRASLRSACFVL
jgi:hypothetical protein